MGADPVGVAGAALRRHVAHARLTERVPIAYDAYLIGRSVERVTGVATTPGGQTLSWTAIVKRTRGPGLRSARRELAVYRHGIASASSDAGLRPARLLGWREDLDEVELWLDEVRDEHGGDWSLERFGAAAGHIAAWDVDAARKALPADFDSEDAWAERHGQPEKVTEALTELDVLAGRWALESLPRELDDPGFARTRALIASTARRIELLSAFPQTPLHHDLVRSNLFAVSDDTTVAIDWENLGRGPLGVDLAPLVVGSVRRGEASSEQLKELESVVLAGYLQVLRGGGVAADEDVRRAYRLAVGLRWHVVLGTIRSSIDANYPSFRGSRRDEPREEALRHLLALSRYILDVGLG
ncbi:MAG: aminoglycoside phosphotransferase family protein [Chloroflexota bacterium]|nr:aminoglycoside phosphotransferase family protein [Chloroflexota bacterium]